MHLLKRKTFESLVKVGDPYSGNSEKRTLLFKSEVKLLVPEVLSPKSALFLLKSNFGKRSAGMKSLWAPDRGLSLDSQEEWTWCRFRLTLCTASIHFPHHQGTQTTQGEEGLTLGQV